MTQDLYIDDFNGRTICIRGIGKMFYQDGFPISIAVSKMKEEGIEVSILHVADECMKNGWSPRTTFNKLKEDFESDIDGNKIDIELLERFCHSSYEEQREMIFQYLWGFSSKEAMTDSKKRKILSEKVFNK